MQIHLLDLLKNLINQIRKQDLSIFEGKTGFKISITVSRGSDRIYKVESEPSADKLGGVYVSNLST